MSAARVHPAKALFEDVCFKDPDGNILCLHAPEEGD